jgi:hypothetical protein
MHVVSAARRTGVLYPLVRQLSWRSSEAVSLGQLPSG